MSKYAVGDKVLVEAEIKENAGHEAYSVEVLGCRALWINENDISNKTYSDGLADAWELARKIVLKAEMGGICYDDFRKIFGVGDYVSVLRTLSPQEALAKIEAYEESKVIKVGDVVYTDNEPDSFGVVTWVANGAMYVLWDDGSNCWEGVLSDFHKTGRTVDIEHLLEQIRGDE